MACSLCGSAAHGEKRWIIGTQPFCKSHFRELAPFGFPRTWPTSYLEASLVHLRSFKARLEEHAKNGTLTEEMMRIAQMSIFPLDPSSWESQAFSTNNEAIAAVRTQIEKIERMLELRKRHSAAAATSQTVAGDPKSSPSSTAAGTLSLGFDASLLLKSGETAKLVYEAGLITPESLSGYFVLTNMRLIIATVERKMKFQLLPWEIAGIEKVENLSIGTETLDGLKIDTFDAQKFLLVFRIQKKELDSLIKEIQMLSMTSGHKAGSSIRIVFDFSSLRIYMHQKGIELKVLKCPSCGAPFNMPESGAFAKCDYCRSTILASEVFQEVRVFSNRSSY
jgi:DNA-directed RNA polymerase subunit RPC12/RpoP